VTGLPAGVTAGPLAIAAGADAGTLTLSATGSAAQGGPAMITVTGTAGALERTGGVRVLVGGLPGTLDQSFATAGLFSSQIGTSMTRGRGVLVLPDEKLVLFGSTQNQVMLMRLLPTGALDDSFGSGGKTSAGNGTSAGSLAAALLADGRIVTAGFGGNPGTGDFSLTGHLEDGSLDPNFGSGGVQSIDVGAEQSQLQTIAVEGDGSVVVAGSIFGPSFINSHVRRVSSAGVVGPLAINATGQIILSSILVLPDGKLLAAGSIDPDGSDAMPNEFYLARHLVDGSPDLSWGGTGVVRTPFGGAAAACGIALLEDGKVLAAGIGGPTNDMVVMARYNSNGSLDQTFGSGGKVTTTTVHQVRIPNELAVDEQGRILIPGYQGDTAAPTLVVTRFTADGQADATFGTAGVVTLNFGVANGAQAGMYGVALDVDGRILVAGQIGPLGATTAAGMARLWP
jgi:uncharacterized delta-60 repeat protein